MSASNPVLALVIDTSSPAVTAGIVAIGDTVEVLAQRVTIDARAHAELLAGSARAALADCGHSMRDVGAVIAGVGPGPYTGLRVGIVTAASFADALQVAAYAVCSLDAIAGAAANAHDLLVASDARRREVYWARYRNGVRDTEPQVHRPAELAELLANDPPAAMAGAGTLQYQEELGWAVVEPAHPSVLALGELAAGRVRGSAPSEVLTPMYLRRPDAEVPTGIKAVLPAASA